MGVLDDIARIAGGIGGAFLVPCSGRWMATPAIEEMMADLMTSDLINNNERTSRLLALDPIRFYRDLDIFDLEDLSKEPVYRDFFIPRGGGFGTATVMDSPSGDRMILHVERKLSRGLVEPEAIERLDQLRPHLARASLLSARMQLRQAASATEALGMLGLAGAVLNPAGRIVAANGLFENFVPAVIQDGRPRTTLADKRADALLQAAIAPLASTHARGEAVSSIPVPATEGHPPVIVHVVPVSGAAHDIFSMASAVLILATITPRQPPENLVYGLFDLTPAEARIAARISSGQSPREAAAQLGITEGTARTTLKRVFAKVGVSRQSELAALLSRLTLG